jgi:hypothetical protein
MKTRTILVAVVALFIFSAQTPAASANSVIQITDKSAIFLIDFAINASYGDFEIPALTDSTVTALDRVDVLGYRITNADNAPVATTQINSLVLGTTPVVNSRYIMPSGTTANYTLVVVATFAESITDDLTASITKFPFWVNGQRTTLHTNQLAELSTATLNTENIAK